MQRESVDRKQENWELITFLLKSRGTHFLVKIIKNYLTNGKLIYTSCITLIIYLLIILFVTNSYLCSDDKGKSRLIREEDHDRSDDDDSQDRLDMTVNTEARDKEKRREAFLASQAPAKCESLVIIFI